MESSFYAHKRNEEKADAFLKDIGIQFEKSDSTSNNVLKYVVKGYSAKWHFIIEEVFERFHDMLEK